MRSEQRATKPKKCARPSCGRARALGHTHCCAWCQLDTGTTRHAPDCHPTSIFPVAARFAAYRRP